MNEKIITALLAILIALSGWSLTTTVGLKSDVAVLKEKVSGVEDEVQDFKAFSRRRNARKRIQITEKAVQALIIGLALVLVLLVGCSYRMVPNETKIEYGTTETDSKNDKLQQKQSITQSWKWIKE